MSKSDALYAALKGDLQSVASPLFDFACDQVQKHGAFLPFGAKLLSGGDIGLVAATNGEDETTSEHIFPLMITALEQSAVNADAVALCEWVKIEVEPGKLRDAVKVHVQHRRGLAVAFYIPATRRMLRSWQFGEMIVTDAKDLFSPWPSA